MKKRVHPLTGVLLIAIVLVLVMVVYRQRLDVVSPEPTVTITHTPQGPPTAEPDLGIAWMPEPGSNGIRVAKILPSPPPSRLALLGVKPGDMLMEVNGKTADLGDFSRALDQLQDKGKPFTMTVIRGGQKVKLEAKKLPESLKGMKFHPTAGAAEGRGGRRGG